MPDPRTVHFKGSRAERDTCVQMIVDGVARPLPYHLDIRNHSPSGFEWGYLGSGPAQLALALCAEVVGSERAQRVYQHVKEQLIAPISADDWSITADEITRAVVAAEHA